MAWFPGLKEENELLQKLQHQNHGVDTKQWSIYEHKEGFKRIHTVISKDTDTATDSVADRDAAQMQSELDDSSGDFDLYCTEVCKETDNTPTT